MKIYNAEKVVKVYVEIETDCGDFRVYPAGELNTVMRWSDFSQTWERYYGWEDHYDAVLELGNNMLHFNKGL